MLEVLFLLIAPGTIHWMVPAPALAAEAPVQRDLGAKLPPTALSTTQLAPRPFRVVIDPGHGGTDTGALYHEKGKRIYEKDITLMLARKIAAELKSRGMSVYLTRKDDDELTLGARTQLANKLKANAFLSIHMNSATGRLSANAEGFETYILNTASNASSERLAHLENSVLGSTYDTSTPEATDVSLILKDLRLDANLTESKKLACAVQQGLTSATSSIRSKKPKNRGIKQALFHVLLGADMPSILVEAGFLSSARDRAVVLSPQGQALMAASIGRAVERFRRSKDQADIALDLNRCRVN